MNKLNTCIQKWKRDNQNLTIIINSALKQRERKKDNLGTKLLLLIARNLLNLKKKPQKLINKKNKDRN